MEKTLLTITAINEEIELCKDVISQFQTKLDELTEKSKSLSNRLNVLRAVGEKLPEGMAKQVNQANIGIIADERFELLPKISKQSNNIEYYKQILNTVIDLKNELEKVEG